ncbi:retrovirus-related pol polyprotein from transposon TNT 1-94, partial [Tanacetum coccineum]
VCYIDGLNHNLFFVGQFCDADLEVAFWKSACYIRDFKGNDLLTGSRGTNIYSITLQDTSTPNPICLMAKASSSQAWLWHRCLSHLNFDTINLLSKYDIVTGLPKLKFVKDHLCYSCELGKAKRKSFKTKITPSSKRRLQILHMDLCGPMRVESFNVKKYVLNIGVILSSIYSDDGNPSSVNIKQHCGRSLIIAKALDGGESDTTVYWLLSSHVNGHLDWYWSNLSCKLLFDDYYYCATLLLVVRYTLIVPSANTF